MRFWLSVIHDTSHAHLSICMSLSQVGVLEGKEYLRNATNCYEMYRELPSEAPFETCSAAGVAGQSRLPRERCHSSSQ